MLTLLGVGVLCSYGYLVVPSSQKAVPTFLLFIKLNGCHLLVERINRLTKISYNMKKIAFTILFGSNNTRVPSLFITYIYKKPPYKNLNVGYLLRDTPLYLDFYSIHLVNFAQRMRDLLLFEELYPGPQLNLPRFHS